MERARLAMIFVGKNFRTGKPHILGPIMLLLLFLGAAVVGTASGAVSPDKADLLSFKAVVSDPRNGLTSWDNSTDPCDGSWAGVTCDNSTSRVTSVSLSSLNLAGQTSTSIAHLLKLDALETLDISHNAFDGALPDVCAAATAATIAVVRVAGNLFTGSLPASFSGCAALRVLDAAGNRLTGEVPLLGSLAQPASDLEELILDENNLSGTIPSSLGSLSAALRTLRLSGCRLRGSIPDQLGSLAALEHLDLARNALDGTVPASLASLAVLRTLDVTGNFLSGQIPDAFASGASRAALRELRLGENQLSGTVPAFGDSSPHRLAFLDLSGNKLSGTIPQSLGKLSSLRLLDLSFNNLTGYLPSELSKLTEMKSINLGHNPGLNWSIPTAWRGFLASSSPPAKYRVGFVAWRKKKTRL